MRTVALALVLMLMATGAAIAQPTDQLLIVPGQSYRPLCAGMSITDAAQVFGTPKPAITRLNSVVLPVPEGVTALTWLPFPEAIKQGASTQGFMVIMDRVGMIYDVQEP